MGLGCVYFIQAGELDFFKIGHVNGGGLDQRLRQLQTGCPHQLTVFAIIEVANPMSLEKALHARLIGAREQGEWYRLTTTQIEHLMGELGDSENALISFVKVGGDKYKPLFKQTGTNQIFVPYFVLHKKEPSIYSKSGWIFDVVGVDGDTGIMGRVQLALHAYQMMDVGFVCGIPPTDEWESWIKFQKEAVDVIERTSDTRIDRKRMWWWEL